MKRQEEIKNRINEINGIIAEMNGSKTLHEAAIGDVMNIKFRDVSMSLKLIGINIYEVVSEGESIKIKKGDLLRIMDEDTVLQVGEKISFEIFRKAMDYQTDPIVGIE